MRAELHSHSLSDAVQCSFFSLFFFSHYTTSWWMMHPTPCRAWTRLLSLTLTLLMHAGLKNDRLCLSSAAKSRWCNDTKGDKNKVKSVRGIVSRMMATSLHWRWVAPPCATFHLPPWHADESGKHSGFFLTLLFSSLIIPSREISWFAM